MNLDLWETAFFVGGVDFVLFAVWMLLVILQQETETENLAALLSVLGKQIQMMQLIVTLLVGGTTIGLAVLGLVGYSFLKHWVTSAARKESHVVAATFLQSVEENQSRGGIELPRPPLVDPTDTNRTEYCEPPTDGEDLHGST